MLERNLPKADDMADRAYSVRSLMESDYKSWRALWLESVAHQGGLSDAAIDATWVHLTQNLGRENESCFGIYGLVVENLSPSEGDDIDLSVEAKSELAATSDKAGFLHYILHPVAGAVQPVCYLQDLYVRPECRKRNIGTSLLSQLKKRSKDLEWERIYWFVEDADQGANEFYKGQSIELPFALHMHPTRLLKEMNMDD